MADIKTDQDHTTSLKDLTKENKKHKPTLEEQRATTEAAIDISKERRKTIEGLITVSDDLKVVEKDNLTAKKAVVDQVKGAGMSIVQGAEGFVTGMFGGPIGGIINTLSVGFLTRWLTNRKQEAETQKDLEKKQEKEDELFDKRLTAMAKQTMDEEYNAKLTGNAAKVQEEALETEKEVLKVEFKRREDEAVKTSAIQEKTQAQAFKAGKSDEEIAALTLDTKEEKKEEAEKNNGVVVPIVDDVEGEGEVAAGEGMSLDTTNQLLTDIEEHLAFMTDNMEDAESRRERLRKLGAKKAGGKVDIKKEDDEGFSFSGLMGTVIGAISGALLGAVAGLSIGFLNMWKMIFKFIGGKLAKIFPNVTKMLSNVFGKGGKLSKFFLAIKAFFTENKAFKTISDGFTKFKTSIKSFGTKVMKFINPILKLFGGGAGGGALKGFSKFGTTFGKFFGVFKGFFSKIFLPLQVIISLFDGFFEAKDAAGKSEGMLATFFNSIIGFFGGILDGLVFGMLDLIKDGIAWVAGFLGFEDVEKFLDSFSFSDMFNEFLDDIYKWFNLLFSDPVAALTNLFSGLFGSVLSIGDYIMDMIRKPLVWLMELFGWDDAAAATETFSLSGWVMEKWDAVVTWIKSIFTNPVEALKTVMGTYAGFLDMVTIPFKKAVAWILGIFGFEEASANVDDFSLKTFITDTFDKVVAWFKGLFAWGKKAGATKDGFSISKLVTEAVDAISKWFSELFDSITNFDFAKFAKGIMPDFLADMIFGKGESEVEKPAEAKKAEVAAQGGEAEKALEKPDTGGMFAAILNPFRTYVKDLLAETPLIPDWVENIVLGAIPGGEVTGEGARGGIIKRQAARGGIVTKPAYLPASGTVVGEHSSWSGGKGAAKGGVEKIPDGPGGEAIIPLAGQAGGQILAAALAPAIAGAILNELMMARAGEAGAEGGGGQTVIQDNSTNQVTNNQTVVRSPSPSGPGLHFEGRDFVHKIA